MTCEIFLEAIFIYASYYFNFIISYKIISKLFALYSNYLSNRYCVKLNIFLYCLIAVLLISSFEYFNSSSIIYWKFDSTQSFLKNFFSRHICDDLSVSCLLLLCCCDSYCVIFFNFTYVLLWPSCFVFIYFLGVLLVFNSNEFL